MKVSRGRAEGDRPAGIDPCRSASVDHAARKPAVVILPTCSSSSRSLGSIQRRPRRRVIGVGQEGPVNSLPSLRAHRTLYTIRLLPSAN